MRWGWLFVSPYVLGLILWTLIPLVISIYFSFTRYDMMSPARWVGLRNFKLVIGERATWIAFRNVWVYAIILESLNISLACVLAVLLNQKVKGLSAFRVIYYIPGLTPTAAVALVWSRLYNPNGGAFNIILGFLGLGPFMFTFSTNWFEVIISVILMTLWKGVGGATIYLIAGLQAISTDVMEAADIDGASPVKKFFRITIPLLTPTIFFLMITGISSALQVFESFYLILENTGAETHVVNSMIYSRMWGHNPDVGFAAALGWVSFIFVAIVTYLQKKYEKKWVHYDA